PAGATFSLTALDNDTVGNNALEPVTSTITVEGNGSVIERAAAGPEMRLFYVGAAGDLRLEDLTLSSGHGQHYGGGGALVDGGRLELTNVTVQDNVVTPLDDVRGGGVLVLGGSLVATDSAFTGNDMTGGELEPEDTTGAAIAVVDG